MESLDCSQIRLRDGRALAYAQCGDPHGTPILYCHGVPSSRAEARLNLQSGVLCELGLRVIVPDRPGVGGSDGLRGRRVADWPADVLELMGALGIQSFGVLGSSGGSPYAFACGVMIPDRVRVIGLIGGLAPPDAPGIATGRAAAGIARFAPVMLQLLVRLQLTASRSGRGRSRLAEWFPEPDRVLLQRPEVIDAFVRCLEEACRQGTRGPAWDMRLVSLPWGIDLGRLETPVLLWQGEQDRNVAVRHGRYLARVIPRCHATFYPSDAHVSLAWNHQREIFGALRAHMTTKRSVGARGSR